MTTAEVFDGSSIAFHEAVASYRALRSYALEQQVVSPNDLQRKYRLTWSEACRALEELEADGVLGSMVVGGVRRWSVLFPVDAEQRLRR